MTPQPLTDSQIHAAFQARSAGSASPDLAERIQSAARATGQQRPLVVLPGGRGIQPQRLLWAAAISGDVTRARRGPDLRRPPATTIRRSCPSPSQRRRPRASRSRRRPRRPRKLHRRRSEPTPSVAPTEPPAGTPNPALVVDGGAITLVGDLRVRSLPTVGENSARLEPLLPANARILIIEGPVAADGYNWYHVMPFDSAYPSGWVAGASRDVRALDRRGPTQCPELPLDPAELTALGCSVAWPATATRRSSSRANASATWLTSTCPSPGRRGSTTIGSARSISANPRWRSMTVACPSSTGRVGRTGSSPDTSPILSRARATIAIEDVDPPPNAAETVATCRAMFVGTDWTSVPID